MKLKFFSYIILLMVIFILHGCATTKTGEKSFWAITETDALSFFVTDVSSTCVSIEIANHSADTLYWGSWFCIEKKENGEWYALEPMELPEGQTWVWEDLLSSLPGEGPARLTIEWNNYYGNLSGGNYRVIKKFYYDERKPEDHFYAACEFSIS